MSDAVDTIDNTVTEVSSNNAGPIRTARTPAFGKDQVSQLRRRQEAQRDYGRGRRIPVKGVKDKKLRGNLKLLESKYKNATLKAKDAEILLENEGGFLEPENDLERTYKVKQDDIRGSVALETAKKGFELKLDGLGPYVFDYTRTGKDLLLAGRKGHVATMDWRDGKLGCELQLGETVRDAKWLHNNQMFAVAQKKYVYIYDSHGVEIHCLKKHIEVTNMEFLPFHYLLATVVSRDHQTFTVNLLIQFRVMLGISNTRIHRLDRLLSKSQPALDPPPRSNKTPTTQSSTWVTKTAPSRSGHPILPRPMLNFLLIVDLSAR